MLILCNIFKSNPYFTSFLDNLTLDQGYSLRSIKIIIYIS
jgi:hypothetical protein